MLTRYVNQYSVNEYAKNPTQRARERDKKKYMCGRFSLMDEFEVLLIFKFFGGSFSVPMKLFGDTAPTLVTSELDPFQGKSQFLYYSLIRFDRKLVLTNRAC